MQDQKTMKTIRYALGWLCLILVPCSVGFGLFDIADNGSQYWWSVSATYYANSKPFMIGILFATGVFFICYRGYDRLDNIIADISAVSAFGIIIFPCECFASPERVGIFGLNVSTSHILHCIFASILFISFAIMIGFRFTKGNTTYFFAKKRRNRIYRICAALITLAMIVQVVTSILDIGWMTIVNETVMLTSMSIAWLVKAGAFKIFLEDKW